MSLLSLPDQILTQVTLNLELKDLLALGDSHTRLRDLVYKTPEIWTSDLLFPVADGRITDRFIKCIVPRITRHYGILSLKMIHLPLTWTGYFMVFDQFAHSVKHVHMKTSLSNLRQLVHHLGVFAGNLAVLQRSNRIPITFRQYSFDPEEYANELAESHYLGQSTLHNLINQFPHMKLDDPPFERLQVFNVDVKEDQDQQEQQHLFSQLESLTCFLSGRTTNDAAPTPSPVPTNQILKANSKRQREEEEEEEQHLNNNSKYMRHQTSPHPQQQQPTYYSYHRHQEPRPDHPEQGNLQQHHHHQITRPYSTTNYV
ncbi:TATA-binding protein (TBP) [Mucor velutinosus]|uniref:TATA-binding protein (TBP) n=1 Tax=Mucor velutinosus TaxID=708070 RepID=A0AAN7DB56_9FUNG|nr:TATA-binding protein (TBP) [Mucor velutinosus]